MDVVIPERMNSSKLDLLDRQEFVDRMLTIANVLSENQKNACYAINGDWGVGKSFVLDMFEGQAKDIGVESEELPRYLIFRYNCWEYDYYEEPLVAIVASILDQIDKKENLISADMKERIVALLKVIGKGLLNKSVQLINEKTGIDFEKAVEVLKNGGEAAEQAVNASHEYDQYFDFKTKLEKLQETISILSTEQTIIFIVDELDRCLPEYTIKVLERLHHLFEGISNVQVILSIDCGQLEHIVRQIYGEKTDAKSYLRKFVQFELKLTEGSLNEHFDERFESYIQLFDARTRTTSEIDVAEFKSYILEGLDMRKRISIIEQCELIHSLLIPDEKVDYSYLCLELFFVVLNDYGPDFEYLKSSFQISNIFQRLSLDSEGKPKLPKGLALLADKVRPNRVPNSGHYKLFDEQNDGTETRSLVNVNCLIGKLLYAYRAIIGFEDYTYMGMSNDYIVEFRDYARQFWDYLQIVH